MQVELFVGMRAPTPRGVVYTVSMFFFVYTIALLVVCIITASVCSAALLATHGRRYLPQILFFVFYCVETSSIFASEWAVQNIFEIDYSNYYDVDMPVFRILVGAGILTCFWLMAFELLDIHNVRAVVIPAVAVVVAQTLILVLMPYGPLRQWLFYTMRQVSLGACLAYCYLYTRHTKDPVTKQRLMRRRRVLGLLSLLVLCILAEDTYVILIAPIPSENSSFVGLFLSSRNFSENMMMLYMAWDVCSRAIRDLRLRYLEPPTSVVPTNPLEPETREQKTHNTDIVAHIESALPSYAAKHGLSKREREVLALALQGKSNREIANELVLAEGTIKTHLHNIMKKCGQPNREALRRDFWAS